MMRGVGMMVKNMVLLIMFSYVWYELQVLVVVKMVTRKENHYNQVTIVVLTPFLASAGEVVVVVELQKWNRWRSKGRLVVVVMVVISAVVVVVMLVVVVLMLVLVADVKVCSKSFNLKEEMPHQRTRGHGDTGE